MGEKDSLTDLTGYHLSYHQNLKVVCITRVRSVMRYDV